MSAQQILYDAREYEEASQATGSEVLSSPSKQPSLSKDMHTLEWNVHSYSVKQRRKRKVLLRDIGSGKSTLLECISLRNRAWEGGWRYDGRTADGNFFTLSALIPQTDLLPGFMKPREVLTFHGIARMGHQHTRQEIADRVEQVLREMKLEKCADTIIGGTDPIFTQKGLSGGERKRLAIAQDLLLAPDVVLLDEPSSGLDSVMAEFMFIIIAELAKTRTIVATAHCPSSDVIPLFQRIILLTCDGRLGYQGPAGAAVKHFVSLGYKCPEDYTPAEFEPKLPIRLIYECPEDYNPADFYLKLLTARPNYDPEVEAQRMDKLTAAYQSSPYVISNPLPIDNAHHSSGEVSGHKASWWTYFSLNLWRGFALQQMRDLLTFGLFGAGFTLVGTLLGILYWQQAASNWRNLLGLCFAMTVSTIFTATLSSNMRVPLEWAMIAREYYSGANRPGPYLCARMLMNIPFLYGPTVQFTIVYVMTGMDYHWIPYLTCLAVFIVFSNACISVGWWCSTLTSNIMICLSALPVIIAPMIMFSGMLIQRSSAPTWLAWLQDISLVNYCFSALMAAQLHILPENSKRLILAFIEIDTHCIGRYTGYMAALTLAFYALTYINLRLRLKFEKRVL